VVYTGGVTNSGTYLSTIYVWTAANQSLTQAPINLPTTLAYHAATPYANTVYIGGGSTNVGQETNAVYYIDTTAWTYGTLANTLRDKKGGLTAVTVGTNLIFAGKYHEK
jgi:hypothetical protein